MQELLNWVFQKHQIITARNIHVLNRTTLYKPGQFPVSGFHKFWKSKCHSQLHYQLSYQIPISAARGTIWLPQAVQCLATLKVLSQSGIYDFLLYR